MDAHPPRGRQTRVLLLEVAKRLFAESGYEQVSVTEIGRAAKVSPSLINAYFGSKTGLLHALFQAGIESMETETQEIAARAGNAPDLIHEVLLAWARAHLDDPDTYRLVMGYVWGWSEEEENRYRPDRARFTDMLVRLLDKGHATGNITAQGDSTVLAETIVALYYWALRDAVFQKRTPRHAIEAYWPHISAILTTGHR